MTPDVPLFLDDRLLRADCAQPSHWRSDVQAEGIETLMGDKIAAVLGDEILDSRGYPTLRVEVRLDSGKTAIASVPVRRIHRRG